MAKLEQHLLQKVLYVRHFAVLMLKRLLMLQGHTCVVLQNSSQYCEQCGSAVVVEGTTAVTRIVTLTHRSPRAVDDMTKPTTVTLIATSFDRQ